MLNAKIFKTLDVNALRHLVLTFDLKHFLHFWMFRTVKLKLFWIEKTQSL